MTTEGLAAGALLVGPSVPPDLVEATGETLVELLERAVARSPKATALIIRRGRRTERWTYEALLERSRAMAAMLGTEGVHPGSRVVTWAANDPWLVAAYFATWMQGALIVPLDLRMQADVARRIALRTRPSLLLVGADLPAELGASLGLPVIRLNGPELGPRLEPSPADRPSVTAEMPAEVLFTSGTTSDPKGVVVTHGQIIHSVRAIAATSGRLRPERALALIPLSHMYGQMVPLLYGILSGSQVTFLASLTPSTVAQVLRRDRITALTLVPHLLRLLIDGVEAGARRERRSERLRKVRAIALRLPFPLRRLLFRTVLMRLGRDLRLFTCGGAHLPPELQLAWEAMGVRVVQGYGATECAAIAGHSRDSRRPGTVGAPLAGMEVRIAPDGELLARGPNVMSGYWEDPAATSEAIEDGWVHTGDAATVSQGELVILGRTRDRIALPSGLKVYPEDVERALVDVGGLKAAVAFEAPAGRIAAVVVPRENLDAAAVDEALRRANSALAPHQRVRDWRAWPEADLPRTHTLKIQRRMAIDWYLTVADDRSREGGAGGNGIVGRTQTKPTAEMLAPASSGAGPPDDLEARLARLVSEVLAEATGKEPRGLDPSSGVEELGMDSLTSVTLAMRIEEVFQAPLEDHEIAGASDLADLAALVRSRIGAAPPPEPSRWAFSRPARAARTFIDALVAGPLVRFLARPTVEGLEHLAALEGPFLICPNHSSHLDVPSLRAVLPARVRGRLAIAAAQDYFFDGSPLGPIVALATGAFPFGRSAHVRAALDRIAEFVEDGWHVLVFPEGTRSLDGRLGEMKEGIGLLATGLGVPIVPAHISGTQAILPKGTAVPRRRGRVRVRIGAPLSINPATPIAEATRQIGTAIAALDPETSAAKGEAVHP